MDRFFLQDLNSQQAMKELLEERATEGGAEAAEAIAKNLRATDAQAAALPKANAEAKAKAKTKAEAEAKAEAEPKRQPDQRSSYRECRGLHGYTEAD